MDKQNKPVVAQVAVNDRTVTAEPITTMSKDQIQGLIAYFNSQLTSDQTLMASTSGGSITPLHGMTLSSSTIGFIGMLRATCNVLSSRSWIIDSGATHHVSHDKSLFVSLTASMDQSVSLPTGTDIKIAGIGQIRLNDYLILNNVLYIPDFRLNLLSISQLTHDLGCRVSFEEDSCMIQDTTKGLMIGQGERISNLYVLEGESLNASGTVPAKSSINIVVDTLLWHNRLGHSSVD